MCTLHWYSQQKTYYKLASSIDMRAKKSRHVETTDTSFDNPQTKLVKHLTTKLHISRSIYS